MKVVDMRRREGAVEVETNPSGHITEALDLLNSKVEEPFSIQSFQHTRQKVVSHSVDLFTLQKLAASMQEDRDKVRLNSLGMMRAGDWLNTVPSKALGLHMRPLEFLTSVKYRLGLPVFIVEGPCTACGRPSDRYGDHALGCAQQGERLSRHNTLRDAIYQAAQQAVLSPTREERYLLSQQGRELERPGDVLIPNWTSGMDTALDITVISPLQASEVKKATEESGSALEHRFRAKMSKYFDACKDQGIHFLPLPVETLGAWHPRAISALTRLGQQLARQTGRMEEETVRHLFQRLSILLMKSILILILSRTPVFSPPGG